MKKSIIMLPAKNYRGHAFGSRVRNASKMAKSPEAARLGRINKQPIVSVSIDAAKDTGFYTRSHDSIQAAREFFKRHPQMAAALFRPSNPPSPAVS